MFRKKPFVLGKKPKKGRPGRSRRRTLQKRAAKAGKPYNGGP